MPRPNEFVEHVVETMKGFGPVAVRAMFGGFGLYHRETFFALILEDTLYLKADDASRAAFEALGLGPCVYAGGRGGRKIVMSYFQAPEEALENPEVMAEWARRAYGAALRVAGARRSQASQKRASPAKKTRGRAA